MTYNRQHSDIQEVADSISLDYASDKFLNVVTANLGIRRPVFGFSDSVWRAVVKAIALRYKQVISAFEEVMTIILGPRVTQAALLAKVAKVGDTVIYVLDASNLPQTGTLKLDAGQGIVEVLDYDFIDYSLNKIYLASPITVQHDPDGVDTAGNIPVTVLNGDSSAGSLTMTLLDTSQFSTVNYPYTVLLAPGTPFEESVLVTNNDTSTNTLTFSVSTLFNHAAPVPSVIRSTLTKNYGADALFLTVDDSSQFPDSGYIGVDGDLLRFVSNDVTHGVLGLHRELATSYVIGNPVELLDVAEIVEMGQIQVSGCGWNIYQTEPRKVEVLVDANCQDLRTLLSASYIHGSSDAPATTALSAPATSGDTTLTVTSTAGFPDRGVVQLGADLIGYHLDTAFPGQLVIDSPPLVNSYASGTVVSTYQPVLTGTLVSGDMWHTPGTWAGPYVYSPSEDGPRFFRTTLSQYLAGPTYVAMSVEDLSNTTVEVEDASYFPSVWPFNVSIGRATGNQEIVQVTAVTLRQRTRDTVSGTGVNPNELPCVGSAATFPHHKGYRVIIDRNGPHEEIAFVTGITGGHFVFENNLTISHSIGEIVELVNDVLTIASFSHVHTGRFPASVRNITHPSYGGTNPAHAELVQVLYSSITVTNASTFELTNTDVILNFGYNRTSATRPLSSSVAPGDTTLSFLDSSSFPPTSACPYFVKLGAGSYNEEIVTVTQNNTGTGQLTIGFPAHYAHLFGDMVSFDTAIPEVTTFAERTGNTLRFSSPIVLESNHTIGELAAEATLSSPTVFGTDFPLHMPSDVLTRLQFLFELVKAAGIEIVFIERP